MFLPFMIRENQRSRFVAIAAVILLAGPGCNPTNETKLPENVDSLPSGSNPVDPIADGNEPIVISGDLDNVDWKSMIGRQVTIEGDLVVVDTYDLVRRGQVKVARKRLYIPTSRVDPNDLDPTGTSFEGGRNVARVTDAQRFNDTATITLDDGSARENIFPPSLFPNLGKSHPTVRIGSVIHGGSGRMVQAGNKLLLVSDQPLDWTPAPRPQRPAVGDADITIASFNVLNFFTTIDNGTNNARGADSESELSRQEAKIVSAIASLKADVIGLMELENNLDAEQRLVAALNRSIGKDVFKGCGVPKGFRSAPGGSDSIRVGIIYRADSVSPVDKVSMIRDPAFFVARTPVIQSFQSLDGGEPFTVIVNHFKSKGGADDANGANKNKGDGQGAYNAARRSQALAISNYINDRKNKQPRVLVIGDLNAYQQEDPIDALRAGGLIDLHESSGAVTHANSDDTGHYSYVYYGQCGSLDHALATDSLAKDVTGIATWHINADEPRFLDYNEEFNPKVLFQDNPFRSSDHDPVLIGVRK